MEKSVALQKDLENWITDILENERPEGISAFRFGIDEIEEGYLLYLAGSKQYDELDDEWASFPPEFVAEKELIISNDDEKEWYWILLEVIYCLGRVLRKNNLKHSFLGGNIPVHTGFPGGDLFRII